MRATLGASEAARRSVGRQRPVGVGAQGRAGERRAQPRQVAGRHAVRGPAARQCQQLRLLALRGRADGARRLRHRALHGRGSGGRAAGGRWTSPRRRRRRATSNLFHPWALDADAAAELACRCEAAAFATDRQHHQLRGCRRVGAAVALLGRQQPRLPRRLCKLAPLDLGGADRGREVPACSATPGTARCATPASWRRPRQWAAMRPSARCRACARARSSTCEVPVLFESPLVAGLVGSLVQAISGGSLYRKASFLVDSLGQPVMARAPRPRRGSAPAQGQGQRTVRRRGRAHEQAPRGRRRRGAGLLPVELLGAQARHAHHRACRRLAEPAR